MARIRCRNYNDNGDAISGGCKALGTCSFIHPSDPGWYHAIRRHPIGDSRGGGHVGQGLGRGAPPLLPKRPSVSVKPSSKIGYPTTTAQNSSNSWASHEPAQSEPEQSNAWGNWDSSAPSTAAWGGLGGADLGTAKGKGKETAKTAGWGDVQAVSTEIQGDWGAWGDGDAAVDNGKSEANSSVNGAAGKDNAVSLDPWGSPITWDNGVNAGDGAAGGPAGGWGNSADAGGWENADDMGAWDNGDNAGGSGVGGTSAWADNEGHSGGSEDPSKAATNTSTMSSILPTVPTREIEEAAQADARDAYAMDVDEEHRRASSHTQTESDIGTTTRDFAAHPPQTLFEKRQACIAYFKQVARVIGLQNRLSKEEESSVRFKRMQNSDYFARVGNLGRQMLDNKRTSCLDKLALVKKDLNASFDQLAKQPGLETYVSDIQPDAEHQLAQTYIAEVKQWIATIQPSIHQVVATERAAQEERRLHSSDESGSVPSYFQPILDQVHRLEERLQNVDAEFDHHAERILDSMVDEKLEQKHADIVATVLRAQKKAHNEAMAQPLSELDTRVEELGRKIEEEAGHTAQLIRAKLAAEEADKKIEADQGFLQLRVAQLEADNANTDNSIREAMQRSKELRAQIEALSSPHASSHATTQLMQDIEPKLQEILRSEMVPVLQTLRERCYNHIDEHQEHLYKAVWTELHPTLLLVDRAHHWMDQLAASAESFDGSS